jgi:tripartite-type tricarboxylate transporter receptor subunit TctC
LPDYVIKKLNVELNKVLATPEFAEQMANEAMTLMPMSPQQFENYIKEDIARWVKVAKQRNIELE